MFNIQINIKYFRELIFLIKPQERQPTKFIELNKRGNWRILH